MTAAVGAPSVSNPSKLEHADDVQLTIHLGEAVDEPAA
jgi:hypothetical protein